MNEAASERVEKLLDEINRLWLAGRVDELAPLLHPDITMVLPGFAGRVRGREQFLAGFRDFCGSCRVHEFHEHDRLSDIVGDTAVLSFRFEMVYERGGESYRATGRDLWVFRNQTEGWLAVWRTMLDMTETAV